MQDRTLGTIAAVLTVVLAGVQPSMAGKIHAEQTTPSLGSQAARTALSFSGDAAATPLAAPAPRPESADPSIVVDCFNFVTNSTVYGSYFTPPDPNGAAGPSHVIVIGNVIVEWRPMAGMSNTPEFQTSLKNFFSALPAPSPNPGAGTTLGTSCYDPKVLYDQYANRFVIVTLERWDTVLGNASNQSRILVAVSKTSDPNDGFWFHAIDSKVNISGVDRWADYPGIGVDDKAFYVTANMFGYGSTGAYGGVRLWIINKTPTYSGPNNNIAYTVNDPYALTGVATTSQPTHMYGTLPNGSTGQPLGTFLVSYSGLSDGTDEYLQFVEVTDPIGAAGGPFFAQQYISMGDLENAAAGLPDAPQLGSTYDIAVNDRRAQNAVWRNNNLYMCATYLPPSGTDAGQTTARWWRINTATHVPGLAIADAGNAGGEDIATGAYTFFPAVAVDSDGNMAMDFALSAPTIYAGAYYATRMAGDPAGTLAATNTLHAGTDYYKRYFGGNENRWGDFSGISIEPSEEGDFWVFNQYAMARGNSGSGSQGAEDGRWATALGKFRLRAPNAVAIASFDVTARDGAVTLRAAFNSDLGVETVNVYRGTGSGELRLLDTVSADAAGFSYVDRTAQPGATYTYRIGVRDPDGEFLSQTETVTLAGLSVALGQNSPNPFNPSTTISFTLPARQRATLAIYDANGRLVRTLVDEVRDFGRQEVRWDGRDGGGSPVGSGVYFYRLTAGKFSESKKMVLVK